MANKDEIFLHCGYNNWSLAKQKIQLEPADLSASTSNLWLSGEFQVPEEAYEMQLAFSGLVARAKKKQNKKQAEEGKTC